jgi:hypothetical protein
MASAHENLAARDLVIEELDQPSEVTEEEATLVALACTCTCGLPFDAAAETVADEGRGISDVAS